MARMLVGEATRGERDYSMAPAAGALAMGWREHWYRFSPNPHNPKPGRVMAPPTPDTGPLPRPTLWTPLGEGMVGSQAQRPDLSSVDELAHRIEDILIINAMHLGSKTLERELVGAGAP